MNLGTALGQGNQPSPQLSKKEEEAAFQKRLKLDPIPKGAIELECQFAIPSEKDIEASEVYFRSVHNFVADERGRLYVPDYALCTIYEFDASGKYLHKFHRSGQGPGELTFPNRVLCFDKKIIVYDGGPRRINFFAQDWRFIKSFLCLKSYIDVAAGNGGTLLAVTYHDDKLIEVLNKEGGLIRAFAEIPYRRDSSLNTAFAGTSPSGCIWVGLAALGRIRKYSQDGVLIKEINIVDSGSTLLKQNKQQNLDWEIKREQKCIHLIKNISFIGEDVLVVGGGLVQPIYRFDLNANLKSVYYIKPKTHSIFYGTLQAVSDKDGKEVFYVLQNDFIDGDIKIGVYVPKKGQSAGR